MSSTLFSRLRPRAPEPIVEDEKRPDAEAHRTDGASIDEKNPSRLGNDDDDTSTEGSEAQDGVKKVEAITSVWTKSALIAVYVMYVRLRPVDAAMLTHSTQHLAHLFRRLDAAEYGQLSGALRDEFLPPALASWSDSYRLQYHRWSRQASACQGARHLGSSSRLLGHDLLLDHWSRHDGWLQQRQDIRRRTGLLLGWVS